jgi:glycosyltransferase involved in cell wall biosynthesis
MDETIDKSEIDKNGVSLVVPMFNEKEYVTKFILAALSAIETYTSNFEIIIVNDGSTDGSEKIADEFSRQNPKIKVIHHKKNKKLGESLKNGFAAANKRTIVYTDMDMPFELSLLPTFLRFTEVADIIKGYRQSYCRTLKRRLYSKAYNILIKLIFGLKVRDVNFAMKIINRKILDAIHLQSEGSFINAEIMIKAQYLGYKVMEIPVVYYPRKFGHSKLSSFSVIAKILYESAKFYPKMRALRLSNQHQAKGG